MFSRDTTGAPKKIGNIMTQTTPQLRYHRILLKLSGEALMGSHSFGIDPAVLDRMATEIAGLINVGVEVGVVIGGGNLFRGKALSAAGLGRVTGDHMGMLATVMNSLAMCDALERIHMPARIMSAISMMAWSYPTTGAKRSPIYVRAMW